MRYRNILFGLMAAVLGTNPLHAQSHVEARKLLDEVRANTRAYADQYIEFNHVVETPSEESDMPPGKMESNGILYLIGDKYRLEIQGQLVIFDGEMSYVISPDDEEVNVFKNAEGDTPFTPNKLLENIDKGASLSLAGEESINGKRIQYIKIRPNGSEAVRDILLGIDMKSKQLYSYQEFGTNDVIRTITIVKYEVNKGLSADKVRFNRADYAGWRINEPRN